MSRNRTDAVVKDFVVIGAGIAGLRAAITLAAHGQVLAVTKEQLSESNTSYAQGGIAVAISGAEDVDLHLADTRAAGDGLVDREAARVLVTEGPLRVQELLDWGTHFDKHPGTGELLLTREAAHSRNRILHANGDSTGAEIGRSLLAHARKLANIELREWTTCVDLLKNAEGRVVGASLLARDGTVQNAYARAVLLASGGAGETYSDTTNPEVATGDGIAAAWRAGAAIADMEFYQFHPTAFSLPGAPRFLLSEALRGEGAWLRNSRGERFMERYHPALELAPRDVVARAITREGLPPEASTDAEAESAGEADRAVYLDLRHLAQTNPELDLAKRFPGISAFLGRYDLRLDRDLLPVRPAAHYLMGGVETDVHGRTSLAGLYAAGEVACTGVHGANRLASNSLLEGLVFGARAGEAMLEDGSAGPALLPATESAMTSPFAPEVPIDAALVREARRTLQQEMWRDAGLLRDRDGLERALVCVRGLRERVFTHVSAEPAGSEERPRLNREVVELRNLLDIAELIVRAAMARNESRGAHFRTDFPARDDERFGRHSIVTGEAEVGFAERGL